MLDKWSEDLSDVADEEASVPRWCIGSGSTFHDQNPTSGI
jgi:hypothetical protein